MKRKWIGIILACTMILGTLTGCGGASQAGGNKTEDTQTAENEEESEAPLYEFTIRELPEPKYLEAAEAFAGGTGTESDPYQISTAAEMALLEKVIREEEASENTEYKKAHYVLTADIELNDTTDFEQWAQNGPEYSWNPISNLGMRIHFDGKGHTISGMYINVNNESSDPTNGTYGLFGMITDGSVKNLTLDKSYISVSGRDANIGGIAGYLSRESEMSDCVSNVTIDVYDGAVGGVVGGVSGGRSSVEADEYNYTEEDDQRVLSL